MNTATHTENIHETLWISKRWGNTYRHQYWQGIVYSEGEEIYIANKYVSTLSDGSLGTEQISEPKRIKGKNIGKANETTPVEQGIAEINSRFNKKLDSGYRKEGDTEPRPVLPMLANKYAPKKVSYPCFVQPKLDGIRGIWCPETKRITSRKGKIFGSAIAHIEEALSDVDIPLDGELKLPEGFSFQATTSAVKKHNENSHLLTYYVYDTPMEEEGYFVRQKLIRDHALGIPFVSLQVLDEQLMVYREDLLMAQHRRFVERKFEGTMIRSPSAPYEFNKRSNSLLKLKNELDEEFQIVAVHYDNRGAAYFECQKNYSQATTPTFEVTPQGSLDERKTKDYTYLIGKWATVKFYDWTEDFAPKFANVVAIRDYE